MADGKMLKRICLCALLGALIPALLVAQYYPRRYGTPGTPKPGTFKGVAGSFHGTLKDLSSKEISIQTEDDQTVTIHRTRKTKFFKGEQSIKPSEIEVGTVVTVESIEEPADLSLTAVSVTVDTPKKGESKN